MNRLIQVAACNALYVIPQWLECHGDTSFLSNLEEVSGYEDISIDSLYRGSHIGLYWLFMDLESPMPNHAAIAYAQALPL